MIFFKKVSGRGLVSAVCKIPSNLDNGKVLADKFDNEGIIGFTCNQDTRKLAHIKYAVTVVNGTTTFQVVVKVTVAI